MPILFNLTRELCLEADGEREPICHPRCLILAPTRELAMQIYRLCYKLTKDKQVEEMIASQANVVISTPGRTLDLLNLHQSDTDTESGHQHILLRSEPFAPSQQLGFKEQLNLMLGSFPSSQSLQVVCCSATFTEKAGSDSLNHPQIRASVETWCPDRYDVEIPNNSIIVNNTSEVSINPLITQDIHVCSEHKKIRKLMDFIRFVQEQDEKTQVRQKSIALIFVNKMKTGEFLLDWIHKNWEKGPSGKQKQGRAKPSKEGEAPEEVKRLRIDFLNSQMTQPYPPMFI
ncbi:uncharacterized protein [Blastocystis hominis]|uniref:ATP-dependent RNA helicase n=1 Tax=Blastocystis hominis TaxID=12968 RepID=D8M4X1_BLAHO|nr:uncharacterized protein [Blastocystis hominis]CBK23110.2 unnamed protein product [Blastocystis hominis]|eukprot:XP_012897158.1 uncharacterized protein [Blastocystis hominis]